MEQVSDAGIDGNEAHWPLRIWALTALGAGFALAIQLLSDLPNSGWEWGARLVFSAILFLSVSGISFGLAWQRGGTRAAAMVATLCGLIAGHIALWNSMPWDNHYSPFSAIFSWQLFCGVLGGGLILTLFQTAQARHPYLPSNWSVAGLKAWKRQALHYADVHEALWTNALLIGLSCLFTGVSMLIFVLLSEMFHLVKIDFFKRLLEKDWFVALYLGGAFGGGMGLLRDRTQIIAALQKVAMIVLRVLAPVLAVGLLAFLAVLPFTGLAPLWATGRTTSLMLSVAVIALFLVNAVIGDRGEEAALSRPLRWGAMALGLALLPMVLIAAWSTGSRIWQHGLSPDRLWALTFIILAIVTAIAYAVAILRRGDWVARLYRSNLHLVLLICGAGLLLSTPLISFDRMATADQVARLRSGRISAVDFDYHGLWFDFGPPGRAAIRRLAKESIDPKVRGYASTIQTIMNRYDEAPNVLAKREGAGLDARLTILPRKVPLDAALRKKLTDYDVCGTNSHCELRYSPGDDYAVVINLGDDGCVNCEPKITLLHRRPKGDWGSEVDIITEEMTPYNNVAMRDLAAFRAGRLEMREVKQRQLFIDGRPYGAPIPQENAATP